MISEQILIDKWRSLNKVQQQEVLDFVDSIEQRSSSENQLQKKRRVKEWLDWSGDNPHDSPGLPDEAVSRDSIYSEDPS